MHEDEYPSNRVARCMAPVLRRGAWASISGYTGPAGCSFLDLAF